MKFLIGLIGLIGLVLLLSGLGAANAQSERRGKGSEREPSADADSPPAGARRGIQGSGLTAIFPQDAACTPIASPYASATRYDGSPRPHTRFGGLHGGIDITLEEATPLLAIAAGKVIASGVGGQAEGIYVWLQHAPKDTGLPFWLYSKYQHLSQLPAHAIGAVVKAGDVVASSGSSGTAGGHYGSRGYAHLHLTTFAVASERFEREGTRIVAEGARMVDPLVIFTEGLTKLDDIDQLADEHKKPRISYVARDGSMHPAESRTVWPVACK